VLWSDGEEGDMADSGKEARLELDPVSRNVRRGSYGAVQRISKRTNVPPEHVELVLRDLGLTSLERNLLSVPENVTVDALDKGRLFLTLISHRFLINA
jgi:hypothetical protein